MRYALIGKESQTSIEKSATRLGIQNH
jgi:hypothetical protein